MADAKPRNLRIVMFPFMAQGHIIPFVALALGLEKMMKNRAAKTIISLVNTPLNIPKLRSNLTHESSISLIELPFNSSAYGLPHEAENCDALPYSLVISLLEASKSLCEPFRDLMQKILKEEDDGKSSVMVIGDFFLGWIGKVCKEIGVATVMFSAAGAFGLGCYRSIWLSLPHQETKQDHFLLDDFPEAGEIEKTQLNSFMLEADGSDHWSVFMQKNIPGWSDYDGFLFNTVSEIDQMGLSYFRRITGVPVWSVGPVFHSLDKKTGSRTTEEAVKAWLDSKPDCSVVYVCFGSVNSISQTHMLELAMALESSEKNFIWVVRPPIGAEAKSEFDVKEYIPEGFEERITKSERGLMVKRWAPQVDILSHKATCVFLSHCGWNSILESLSHGVPLLGWPMAGEQFFNSILMEKHIGVSVEVARGKRCDIKCDEIVSKIKLVVEETDVGREIRKKAKDVKELVRRATEDSGSSIIGLEDFLGQAMVKKDKN
ncbi:hypothetical protein CARUB_v10003346mg [Capsella rubella]|uniref:Glycosyltransferase n=1 Tax=Capsella rubella TaxID=81985 RepID=R0H096_9BRAS|nr:UDP-glycosyltransferase 92A1 [Capsella rubella]EOA22654.1 hypothetical protein CARUB_v10003346mg [Capsella rubella]